MKRAKFVNVRYNYVRECIEYGHLTTIHVDGSSSGSDGITTTYFIPYDYQPSTPLESMKSQEECCTRNIYTAN